MLKLFVYRLLGLLWWQVSLFTKLGIRKMTSELICIYSKPRK